jgi:hypothetical protein
MYELSMKETDLVAGGEAAAAVVITAAMAAIIYLGGPTYYGVETPVFDIYGREIGTQVDTYRRPGFLW